MQYYQTYLIVPSVQTNHRWQTQLKNIILTGITRQHQYCCWDRRKSLLHLWKFNSLITVTFPGNTMQGMVRKLTYSLGISKVRAVIRMSEFPLSDTLQWHQGLNAQGVTHEFKEILALKESLKFRLLLEKKNKKKKGTPNTFMLRLGQHTANCQWLPPFELCLDFL